MGHGHTAGTLDGKLANSHQRPGTPRALVDRDYPTGRERASDVVPGLSSPIGVVMHLAPRVVAAWSYDGITA